MPPPEREVTHNEIFYQLGELTSAVSSVRSTVEGNSSGQTELNAKLEALNTSTGTRVAAMEIEMSKLKTWGLASVTVAGVVLPVVWWFVTHNVVIN